MAEYLNKETENGWYLCMLGDQIVGGLDVIDNDFHDRKDLSPNVCAVYTEEAHRKQGIAGKLLNLVVDDMIRLKRSARDLRRSRYLLMADMSAPFLPVKDYGIDSGQAFDLVYFLRVYIGFKDLRIP